MKNLIEDYIVTTFDKPHPPETSILETSLSTVFTLDDNYGPFEKKKKKLPECIIYFEEKWVFGDKQRQGPLLDAKKIWNAAIQASVKKIKDAYSVTSDCGLSNYLKQLLEENVIEE